jgi:hypothetical protein
MIGATIDTSGSCPSPLEMARSRLLRLLQLRKLRYKATATPMEDGTLDMEQIPERQHTILQIEQASKHRCIYTHKNSFMI